MNLERFPRRTLRSDRFVHRIPRAVRHPWWFSDNGAGRFDPVGTGFGACYLAEDPLGAWIEVFRKRMLIAEDEIRARALASTRLGHDLRLADLTSRRAPAYGATASIGAGGDDGPSQRFAGAALAAGFEGVRYLLRHDPKQRLYGIAVFGPAGAADPADPQWPAGDGGAIPDALLAEAARRFGYRVLPAP